MTNWERGVYVTIFAALLAIGVSQRREIRALQAEHIYTVNVLASCLDESEVVNPPSTEKERILREALVRIRDLRKSLRYLKR